MDPVTLSLYVQLGFTAFRLGSEAYATFRTILKAHGLTDEDIDRIEAGIRDEAERRRVAREEMAKPGGGE